MKTFLLAVAISLISLPAGAAPRHHGHHAIYAQPQIACTQYGCNRVPRGCHPESGRTGDGLPSGFDVVTCGNITMYGNR
jgi:hypothetical protein